MKEGGEGRGMEGKGEDRQSIPRWPGRTKVYLNTVTGKPAHPISE